MRDTMYKKLLDTRDERPYILIPENQPVVHDRVKIGKENGMVSDPRIRIIIREMRPMETGEHANCGTGTHRNST
jgi:hypothetical protein